MGPCVYSQEFDPKTLTNMDVVTFEVTNGAKIRGPLPFGMFAEVIPMNMNKSKLVVKVSPHEAPNIFNILRGQQTDKELWAPTQFTEQLVSPDSTFENDPTIEYKPIDEYLSLKITRTVPTTALNNYVLSFPKSISLDLPRVLQSVSIVWNESYDRGQRYNYFNSAEVGTDIDTFADNADADSTSGGYMPEVQIDFQDYSASNLFSTAYFFFLPMSPAITEAVILTKLNALTSGTVTKWPVFKPKSHTISLLGQSAKVAVQTSASGRLKVRDSTTVGVMQQSGYGDDISGNLSNGTIQIPPSIHGTITFTGIPSKSRSLEASATSPVYINNTLGASVVQNPMHTRSTTINASVSPTSFSPTSPAAIPTSGLYLTDVSVQPYDYGYAKVYAEVFNASQLA